MGIACVTCIACITCMACIGRNAAQYGRRCRIESKLLGHQRRLGEQGRQASRRPDGSENWTGREGKDLGSVALETLCDVTLALRSLSLSWRFADPNWPPRRLTLTQQQ